METKRSDEIKEYFVMNFTKSVRIDQLIIQHFIEFEVFPVLLLQLIIISSKLITEYELALANPYIPPE